MKSQKNIEVIVNHQASLDFTVSKPDLQAKWYKNGQLLDITNDERCVLLMCSKIWFCY